MYKLRKGDKLHINFHNPNSTKETVKFLTRLIANTAVEKNLNNNIKNHCDSLKIRQF